MIGKLHNRLYWCVIKWKSNYFSLVAKIQLWLWNIKYGASLIVRGRLIIENRGTCVIGDNCTFNSAQWANPIGGGEQTCIKIFPQGNLTIRNSVGISNSAITCMESVYIGENVLIGAGCRIYDTDFHPLQAQYRYGETRDDGYIKSKPVIIESGAFIGGGSIILKGTHIGKNSIIGAGSVVSGIVPDGEIWGGNPARYIRKV